MAYKYNVIVLFLLLTMMSTLSGQERQIRVIGESSTESLAQAYGQNRQSRKYAIADEDGYLRIAASAGDTIRISYVGFRDTNLVIKKDVLRYVVPMRPGILDEVVVFGEENFNQKAALGLQNVPLEFLKALPGLTGETDVLKSITFLPGVTGGREGYSHLFVRGGKQDQNLMLFDGATLFNVNHAAGFISLFNTSLISQVDFYKSYWPSFYGGRLSSVLDVRTKNGNKEHFDGTVDIGIVTSKVNVSGPLFDNGKTSYSLGARTTLLDLFFLPKRIRINNRKTEGSVPGYTFYDLNAKIDHRFKDDASLSLSLYHGSDIMLGRNYEKSFNLDDDSANRYGLRNWTAALNYSRLLSTRHSLQGHVSYSRHRNYLESDNKLTHYDFKEQYISTDHDIQRTDNAITSLKARINGKYYSGLDLGMSWNINYGLEAEQLAYRFGYQQNTSFITNTSETSQSFTDNLKGPESWLISPYLDAEIELGNSFRIKGGSRITRFFTKGRQEWLPEPKAMLIWETGPHTTINAAYNRQHQPIHMVAYNVEAFFIENFVLADPDILPSSSHQYSLGYFQSLQRWIDNLSLELYYKKQDDVVKYIPPYKDFQTILDFKSSLFQGGYTESYGAEIMIQKTSGDFHGSVAYTWANAESVFPALNQGNPFPADFDYRNQFNTLLVYQINPEYRLSAQWVFLTGRPITWSNEEIPGDPVTGTSYEAFPGINNERLPAYHRLDIGLRRDRVSKKTGKKYWFSLNVYNAYYRKNPYSLERRGNKWKLRSIFPIIPSINLGFEL
ncbi:TonB-dependent receptor plug domain-containing protein [Membranicola marinus]|uniref:TonB-dependent receptor plug domain-containing protein n=1 Tax=Membranihabitans marinus TaxID=1227546 RepID=A0A953LAP1_9BACT|nr:TonB-dependent receptor plug domain-containing protein [Membranihabitans marinus]MBY5958903.1 TonB-dependent receptor plug domain-containing protein [Membranihabitans marinus]